MKQDLVNKLDDHLKTIDLKIRIEVIAQLFIRWGMAFMLHKNQETLSPEEIVKYIINDRKTNGETLANALAQQGLELLMWLGE